MSFCFGVSRARKSKSAKHTMDGQSTDYCIFCDIARGATSTSILFSDEKVVAFPDINPSAFRHYLVIPVEHVPTVNSLEKKLEHYELVNHMLKVGEELLNRDAPNSVEHRFGFHQPPFNSINHLHLHCLALPFTPAWKQVKYTPLGRLGFIGANKVLTGKGCATVCPKLNSSDSSLNAGEEIATLLCSRASLADTRLLL